MVKEWGSKNDINKTKTTAKENPHSNCDLQFFSYSVRKYIFLSKRMFRPNQYPSLSLFYSGLSLHIFFL